MFYYNIYSYDFSCLDQPIWGQGINNNVRDNLITNQVGGMSSIDASLSLQNNIQMPIYAPQQAMTNQFGGLISPPSISSQLQPTLLSNLQEVERQRSVQTMNDLQNVMSSNSSQTSQFFNGVTENTNTITPSYGHNIVNNLSNNVIYTQAASWAHENMSMNMQLGNNSYYSSSSDPTMEYFLSTHDFNPEVNDWSWKSG